MQHDERQPTSGRPSLLSTEQQADADRNRKPGILDGKPGAASGSMPGKRKYSLLAGALVAVVAIGAGSAVWLSSEGEKEIVLAGSAPLPAAPAPAAPLASDLPAPEAEMDDVSTAAILEDAQPAEGKAAAPALPVQALTPSSDAVLATAQSDKSTDDLTSMLERPSGAVAAPAKGAEIADLAGPAPAKPVPKPAAKPPAKPAPKKPVLAKAAPAKTASKATGQKSGQKSANKSAAAAAAAKKKAQAQPKPPQDTDVTLLAALVAHSKATAPKKTVTQAEKLRQCKKLGSESQADQCRARLCATSAKNEAQCKAARLAKGPAES